jgi:glycine/D-amino acid oxidase-like deaminating enzyme
MIKEKFVQLLSTYAIAGEQAPGKQTILNSTLFWNTADPYFYMRTTDDNRLLMGGADEDFVDPQKRDLLLAAKAEKLQRELNKMLPHYNFKMDFAWTGTFGSTKDGLPFIGKHPDFKNAYFVLGFGGNGITFSVIGMEVISAMLKKKKHPLQHYYRFGR